MQVAEAIHRYGQGPRRPRRSHLRRPAHHHAARPPRARRGRRRRHPRPRGGPPRPRHAPLRRGRDRRPRRGRRDARHGLRRRPGQDPRRACPKERQTALFSATIAGQIARLAERHLHDPVRVRVHETPQAKGEEARVRQVAYVVRRADKLAALGRILDLEDGAATLVFARTRGEVDDLAEALSGRGRRRCGAPRRALAGAARPDHGSLPRRSAGRARRHRRRRARARHRPLSATSSTTTSRPRPTSTSTGSAGRGVPGARA